jgi:hypothetical protein
MYIQPVYCNLVDAPRKSTALCIFQSQQKTPCGWHSPAVSIPVGNYGWGLPDRF